MLNIPMPRLCCQLITIYMFFPTISESIPLSRNFAENNNEHSSKVINHPPPHLAPRLIADSCSTNHIVKWLNFGDLAELVSKWAEKENSRPIWVLEQLSNNIGASEHIHQFVEDRASESGNRHLHLKPLEIPLPISPVGDVSFKPPFGLPGGPPPFAVADVRPPNMAVLGSEVSDYPSSFMPIVPFAGLRPPSDATVRIAEGIFATPLSTVTVTVTPRMSVIDAVQQAVSKFRDGDVEKYITWGKNNVIDKYDKCTFIRSIGNFEMNRQFVWEIIITDSLSQEIWRSVCLPSVSEVLVKPGTIITLDYLPRVQAGTD
ncbi:hypothetical protein CHUAL_005474 [Chamberlinius hualienensis]